MKKILTVVGARPQFVKAAVVSRALQQEINCQEILVHTGQHFDKNMSDVFFDEMDIPKPDYSLGVNSMSHGKMTGHMLIKIEEVMMAENPDAVLVYGDTNSTLAAALAAAKLHIPVSHVEAGLRSLNMRMPEEINRILTDRVSEVLFCPTQTAVENLGQEGIVKGVQLCGDVMLDATLHYAPKARFPEGSALPQGGFILATFHREENTSNPENLREIVGVLNELHSSVRPVIVPLHPGTKQKLKRFGLQANFYTIAPVSYFEMLGLLRQCELVMTDSGGLQKEAYFFQKFCVTLRNETEWVELVQSGVNQLCGANRGRIFSALDTANSKGFSFDKKLYGNGNAGQLIASELTR